MNYIETLSRCEPSMLIDMISSVQEGFIKSKYTDVIVQESEDSNSVLFKMKAHNSHCLIVTMLKKDIDDYFAKNGIQLQ